MSEIIEARVLKGFRDILPEAEIERASLVDKLTNVFRSFGFVPIDTPVLEYAEILLGKGGGETEKQVYRFKDNGGRDVAMRFDLTVPFARFMAEHASTLALPFKRYHMAKVWRGENTQRGRYREFMQCDFDTVGVDSAAADYDILSTINSAMKALAVPNATININHRGIFNRFLEKTGVIDKSIEILRTVDKLDKIGKDETKRLLSELTSQDIASDILEFIRNDEDYSSTFDRITRLSGGANPESDRVATLFDIASACGIEKALKLSPNITRGLDYYTGVVFETFLNDIPEIGSVCSGGRYNDLASLYTKQKLPGVGASVGIDRLIAALEELGKTGKRKGYTDIVIANVDKQNMPLYQKAACEIRNANLICEVFPDDKKIGQQFAWAESKGAGFALVRGSAENEKDVWVLREFASRTGTEYKDIASVIEALKKHLQK